MSKLPSPHGSPQKRNSLTSELITTSALYEWRTHDIYQSWLIWGCWNIALETKISRTERDKLIYLIKNQDENTKTGSLQSREELSNLYSWRASWAFYDNTDAEERKHSWQKREKDVWADEGDCPVKGGSRH